MSQVPTQQKALFPDGNIFLFSKVYKTFYSFNTIHFYIQYIRIGCFNLKATCLLHDKTRTACLNVNAICITRDKFRNVSTHTYVKMIQQWPQILLFYIPHRRAFFLAPPVTNFNIFLSPLSLSLYLSLPQVLLMDSGYFP